MFGFATWGKTFFNKKASRTATKHVYNLRGNFSTFGGGDLDDYFAVAPLWTIHIDDYRLV